MVIFMQTFCDLMFIDARDYARTVFPQNLAAARFYFKALFGAAIIQGRLDVEGSVYRH